MWKNLSEEDFDNVWMYRTIYVEINPSHYRLSKVTILIIIRQKIRSHFPIMSNFLGQPMLSKLKFPIHTSSLHTVS